jgi:hypothetical protein
MALLATWALVPLVAVLADVALPRTTIGWDFANLLGFAAVGITLLLFIETGRPRHRPPFEGRYFINLHRDLGIVVLALVTAHVAYVLIDEPVTVEYLLPTAPVYMLSGLLAFVVLVTLVVFGFKRVRVALFANHRVFRTIHWVSAVGFVLLTGWHVLGSGFYLRTMIGTSVAVVGTTAVVAVWASKRRRPRRDGGSGIRVLGVAHFPEWMTLALTVFVLIGVGTVAVLRFV